MSTAGLGATYSPPSPLELHYSDAVSAVYPDRPIRPLPRRRLRSRLSPEAADSILCPTPTAPKTTLFQIPYKDGPNQINVHEAPSENDAASVPGSDGQGAAESASYQFKGNELGSEDEESAGVVRRYHEQRQRAASSGTTSSRNGYIVPKNDASKYMKPPISQSALSSGDSVDGYDSFENTNNKKKRKIPALGSHHSSLSAEMASMGISSIRDIDVSQADQDGGVGHYYGTGSSATPAKSSGTGISGAGRGRYGRAGGRRHSGRSPLGVSFNGLNYPRKDYAAPAGVAGKEAAPAKTADQGIISAAIANAAAIPATPANGRGNVSLLEQQSSKKTGSAKTQFTFTCESDSAKSMMWPGYGYSAPNGPQQAPHPTSGGNQTRPNKGFATQGTQTSPNMTSQPSQANTQQAGTTQQTAQQPKKPRRPLVKQYAMAARERRLRQNYNNYNHPPKEEDVWVCDFCEYESIFGTPPEALIRQYEIKDRRERRRLAEKRRLLEKAKMKGRKGKKGNKNAAKNANATQAQQPNQKQRYDQQPADEVSMENQGTQSEDYVLDEEDDDPIPVQALSTQTPSKIPQPVAQNQNHSVRSASGGGSARATGGAGRPA